MLKKFRKSVKVTEKKRGTSDTLARTPIRSTFGGSISSRDGDRISWNSSSASDSGYGSISSSSESRTSSSHVEGFTPSSMASLPPPRRCPTYSSSLYSDDVDHHETAVHPMPITVEDEDEEDEDLFDLQPVTAVEYHEDHFDLPPRTLSNYSNNFTPKSRFARLNQLPFEGRWTSIDEYVRGRKKRSRASATWLRRRGHAKEKTPLKDEIAEGVPAFQEMWFRSVCLCITAIRQLISPRKRSLHDLLRMHEDRPPALTEIIAVHFPRWPEAKHNRERVKRTLWISVCLVG
ncbi:hypothetical protein M406DRAFT_333102 [Cryphonectria parasitica EP155]|uniref:Uncharacterized protein n=1 Tax=Cryphonectria parasitica (strain ATCC 38755 / EP155) TaxID=660469 RepID=A0A9P4XXI2_CRYP1|nr:uncharacterized protein M406DRAFT_333102 [Cryphonectria parasitica EP155]KAF3762734.1 hypothetical protein M406DRAFT_333102 [Cryphonectria parasitica EP155]